MATNPNKQLKQEEAHTADDNTNPPPPKSRKWHLSNKRKPRTLYRVLFLFLFVCVFVCLFACLLACLFVCLIVCLFVCLCIHSFIYLFIYFLLCTPLPHFLAFFVFAASGQKLARIMGPSRAKELHFTGRFLKAQARIAGTENAPGAFWGRFGGRLESQYVWGVLTFNYIPVGPSE